MSEISGKHVMVDIETLGQDPGNHIILSIAAVKFDSEGVYTEDIFDEEISKKSCENYGMGSDQDTIDWWEEQEATYTEDGRPLPEVLKDFSDWLPDRRYKIWSKGPSFDCTFLKKAYKKCGLGEEPWNFWLERDVRTAEDMFSRSTDGSSPEPNLQGTDHDPAYDVKKQALSVLISLRGIKR
jgi:DNA polymerase III epsilon subunit-like protein